MADYKISFARSARKELQELDSRMAARGLDVIESLAVEPRPSGCRKIRASTDLFRVRVGNYRVIYRVDDAGRLVDVAGIRHRGTHIKVFELQPRWGLTIGAPFEQGVAGDDLSEGRMWSVYFPFKHIPSKHRQHCGPGPCCGVVQCFVDLQRAVRCHRRQGD